MGAANPTATKPETTVATDPVLAALKAQHDLLAAQVAIQKDQQALFTSTLPTSNATPSSGAFTVSGTNPFPSQRLAYIQLGNIGAEIGERVAHAGVKAVAFLDATEISALINYDTVTSVLMNLELLANKVKAKFDGDIRPMVVTLSTLHDVASKRENASLPATTAMPPMLLPGLILAGLKTASDIVGMFRMNTNVAYSNFILDDAALIADVANALISKRVAAYQPALMPGAIAANMSRFMTLLSNIQSTVAEVQYELSSDQARIQQLSDALNAFIVADRANEQNRDEASALTDPVVPAGLKVKQAGLQRERDLARLYVLRLVGANADLDAATSTIWKAECQRCPACIRWICGTTGY